MMNLPRPDENAVTQPSHSSSPALLSGSWNNGTRWAFQISTALPELTLATSVFCAAIVPQGLVLTRTHRGVEELLGGHIEPGESIVDTLCREAVEEGGVDLQIWAPIGLRELFNDSEIINKSSGQPYPSRSFMPYFVGFSELPLQDPTGTEIVSRRVVPIVEALKLDLDVFPDRREFELMLRHCLELTGVSGDVDLRTLRPRDIHEALSQLAIAGRKE